MKEIVLLLLASLLFLGCFQTTEFRSISPDETTGLEIASNVSEESAESTAINLCKTECLAAKSNGTDLSNGPCLSNHIHPDWVCDIAHDPRQAVDNQQENQCPAFREGTANHFVELDENCEIIETH